jgi:hypothetical protein
MRRAAPDEDDRAAFRAAVADANPLHTDRVLRHDPPRPLPIPRFTRLDHERLALAETLATA